MEFSAAADSVEVEVSSSTEVFAHEGLGAYSNTDITSENVGSILDDVAIAEVTERHFGCHDDMQTAVQLCAAAYGDSFINEYNETIQYGTPAEVDNMFHFMRDTIGPR